MAQFQTRSPMEVVVIRQIMSQLLHHVVVVISLPYLRWNRRWGGGGGGGGGGGYDSTVKECHAVCREQSSTGIGTGI